MFQNGQLSMEQRITMDYQTSLFLALVFVIGIGGGVFFGQLLFKKL
jgi:hypothetical protein